VTCSVWSVDVLTIVRKIFNLLDSLIFLGENRKIDVIIIIHIVSRNLGFFSMTGLICVSHFRNNKNKKQTRAL